MLDGENIYTNLDLEDSPFSLSESEYYDCKQFLNLARISGTLYAITQVIFLSLNKRFAYDCEILATESLFDNIGNWGILCKIISGLSIAAAVAMFAVAVMYIIGGGIVMKSSASKLGISDEDMQPDPDSEEDLKAADKMYTACQYLGAQYAIDIQRYTLPIISCLHFFAACVFYAITGEFSYFGILAGALAMSLMAHYLTNRWLSELNDRNFLACLYFSSHTFKLSQYKKYGLILDEDDTETIEVCEFLERQAKKRNAKNQDKKSDEGKEE